MAEQSECPSESQRAPRDRVMSQDRVMQDNDRVPVVGVNKGESSLGVFVTMFFLALLLGVILAVGVNYGEFIHSQKEPRAVVLPPRLWDLPDNQIILSEGAPHAAGIDVLTALSLESYPGLFVGSSLGYVVKAGYSLIAFITQAKSPAAYPSW